MARTGRELAVDPVPGKLQICMGNTFFTVGRTAWRSLAAPFLSQLVPDFGGRPIIAPILGLAHLNIMLSELIAVDDLKRILVP